MSAAVDATPAAAGAPLPPAVEVFREYLRCKTVHPDPTPGYEQAATLLKRLNDELGLEWRRVDLQEGHPIISMKWEGSDPSLPSIVLNSHMDVVPVEAEKWTKDPWAAEVVDGKIYGRGTQDMKSVGIQYIEALRLLKAAGYKPLRTIYVLWVPDEEVGGNRGIKLLLGSAIIREMNPGLVLDEGLASPTDKFTVFYGERKIWWIKVTATGAVGHGSRFVQGTAVDKLLRVANKMLAFRDEQRKELEAHCHCGKQLGDYTTINMTMLSAGDPTTSQYNVIPGIAVGGFDCRIPATVDLAVFKAQLDDWCGEDGVSYEWVSGTGQGALANPTTSVAPDSYWWGVFSGACAAAGAPLHEPSIFPAATDSRWIRLMLGTPCFGFSPMRRTPILLHDHDEMIPVEAFLEGISIYEKLIPTLADAKEPEAAAAAAAASDAGGSTAAGGAATAASAAAPATA